MKDASHDLYAFAFHTLRGICNKPEKVHITICETPPKTTTLILDCDAKDLRFVFARLREIKIIAISIAQRHKALVNVFVNDMEDEIT